MTILLRIVLGAVALAFVFAVVNLFVSDHSITAFNRPAAYPAPIAAQVPDAQAAALSTPEAATPTPTTPQIMRDMAFALIGIETSAAAPVRTSHPTTLPSAAPPLSAAPAAEAALPLTAPQQTTLPNAAPALTSSPLDAATPSEIRLVLTTPETTAAGSR